MDTKRTACRRISSALMLAVVPAMTGASCRSTSSTQREAIILHLETSAQFNLRLVRMVEFTVSSVIGGPQIQFKSGEETSGQVGPIPYRLQVLENGPTGLRMVRVRFEGNVLATGRFDFALFSPTPSTERFQVQTAVHLGNQPPMVRNQQLDENADAIRFRPGRRQRVNFFFECLPDVTCVRATNTAPEVHVLPDVRVKVGAKAEFSVEALDEDAELLSSLDVSLTPAMAASGAALHSVLVQPGIHRARFEWTPGAEAMAGSPHVVRFCAADERAANACAETMIHVNAENSSPILDAPPRVMGSEGEVIAFSATALDPDGDKVTVRVLSGPGAVTPGGNAEGISGAARWEYRWLPGMTDAGEQRVTIEAAELRDGVVAGETSRRTIVIRVGNVNQMPQIIDPGPQMILPGEAWTLPIRALDADDPEGFSLHVGARIPRDAAGAVLDEAQRAIRWQPEPKHQRALPYVFDLTVNDGEETATLSVPVFVSLSRCPRFDPVPPQRTIEEKAVCFPVRARTDGPDSVPAHFVPEQSAIPAGVQPPVRGEGDAYCWSPRAGDVGNWFLAFSVPAATSCQPAPALTVPVIVSPAVTTPPVPPDTDAPAAPRLLATNPASPSRVVTTPRIIGSAEPA